MFRHRQPKFRPALESLEGRLCLSAADLMPAVPAPDAGSPTDLVQEQRRLPASHYMLELEGIKGESKDDKHKSQIDSFAWSAANAGARSGGGGGAGKVQMQDFHFVAKSSTGDLDLTAEGSTEHGTLIPIKVKHNA